MPVTGSTAIPWGQWNCASRAGPSRSPGSPDPNDVVDTAVERLQSGDDEAMVIGVGDVDVPVAALVYCHFAGEGERRRGRPGLRRRAGGPKIEHAAVQPAVGHRTRPASGQ